MIGCGLYQQAKSVVRAKIPLLPGCTLVKFHIIIASRNYTTVIVAENHYRPSDQLGIEDTLTRHVEIITVNEGNRGSHTSPFTFHLFVRKDLGSLRSVIA